MRERGGERERERGERERSSDFIIFKKNRGYERKIGGQSFNFQHEQTHKSSIIQYDLFCYITF